MYEEKSIFVIKEVIRQERFTLQANATGFSMSPIIKEGDTIVIKPTTFGEIRTGDIVVFDSKGRLCCHRLIMKYLKDDLPFLVTKSDKTLVIDLPFKEEELLGKVSCIQRETRLINLESIFWTVINRILGLYHLLIAYCTDDRIHIR